MTTRSTGRSCWSQERPAPSFDHSLLELYMPETTNPQPDRYRQRADEVEAVQWTDGNAAELEAFAGSRFMTIDPEDRTDDPDATAAIMGSAYNTWALLRPGDWVIKLGENNFRSMPGDEFAVRYEPAAHAAGFEFRGTAEVRAAALREAADGLVAEYQRTAKQDDARHPGLLASIELLRRMADEEQQPSPVHLVRILAAHTDSLAATIEGFTGTAASSLQPGLRRTLDFLKLYKEQLLAGQLSAEMRRLLAQLAAEAQQQTEFQPARGDQFEAWLKAQRAEFERGDSVWPILDWVLDTYRLHADTGTPLSEHVCEGKVAGDCECLEQPAVVAAVAGEELACAHCGHSQGRHMGDEHERGCHACWDLPGNSGWNHRFQGHGTETVHGCPPDGSGLTPCCGRTPFELPLGDRISSEAPITCTGPSAAAVSQPGKEA